jgi:hypothetical protein
MAEVSMERTAAAHANKIEDGGERGNTEERT